MRNALLTTLILLAAVGCTTTTTEEGAFPKADAMAGKADGADLCALFDFAPGCDLCGEFGWYGDGECDSGLINAGICAGPDSDCAPDSAFASFRIGMSGFCPPEVDCNGFVELHADGSLRFDRTGELPAVVHETTVDADELAEAVAALTAPALIDLLAAAEPPCSSPTDIYEGMTLELEDATHQNSTTFCRQGALVDARKALSDLTDRHFPAPARFDSFRISTSGFCPPELDCNGFVELHADGTLRVDGTGEISGGVHEATVTPAELGSAVSVLTDPALIELLAMDEAPCSPPTDVYESMSLALDGTTYDNSTTFCRQAPLAAARAALHALAETYAP
ncbi:MAG: hypothetical protein DRJ42_01525 [Deltaproteobacteria bacterium]|nr:MAG: hypothetical protein DRJ42_01525 [Deltaproteobacteria bacterium]